MVDWSICFWLILKVFSLVSFILVLGLINLIFIFFIQLWNFFGNFLRQILILRHIFFILFLFWVIYLLRFVFYFRIFLFTWFIAFLIFIFFIIFLTFFSFILNLFLDNWGFLIKVCVIFIMISVRLYFRNIKLKIWCYWFLFLLSLRKQILWLLILQNWLVTTYLKRVQALHISLLFLPLLILIQNRKILCALLVIYHLLLSFLLKIFDRFKQLMKVILINRFEVWQGTESHTVVFFWVSIDYACVEVLILLLLYHFLHDVFLSLFTFFIFCSLLPFQSMHFILWHNLFWWNIILCNILR